MYSIPYVFWVLDLNIKLSDPAAEAVLISCIIEYAWDTHFIVFASMRM